MYVLRFCYCHKIPEFINFRREKVYSGTQVLRFQVVGTIAFGPITR